MSTGVRFGLASSLAGIVTGALTAAPVGTAFTYQGQLRQDGVPVSGSADFRCSLWDEATGGTQVGPTLSLDGTAVENGFFVLTLDFGPEPFIGEACWLQIMVRAPAVIGDFTTLSPRQALTSAPHALFSGNADMLDGLHGTAFLQAVPVPLSLSGEQDGGPVVEGVNESSEDESCGVRGRSAALSGITYGVFGSADSPAGYGGYFHGYVGAWGESGVSSGSGVVGRATSDTGPACGVVGQSESADGVGVVGDALASTGQATGVAGHSYYSPDGFGVFGYAGASFGSPAGVFGVTTSPGGRGVMGYAVATGGVGVYGTTSGAGFAGYFHGDAYVTGDLGVGGTLYKAGGSFKIDHPLDPANQYLYHSFVESPDMKNVYDGIVVTDDRGYAVVLLPDWFQALNRECRYQLTVIDESDGDGFVLAKVVKEVQGDHFIIRTSAPQTKVSWQVTGIRQDAWAEANRIPVEQTKPAEERGTYLHPEALGLSPEFRTDQVLQTKAGVPTDATLRYRIEQDQKKSSARALFESRPSGKVSTEGAKP